MGSRARYVASIVHGLSLLLLYKHLVRSHLEHCNSVSATYEISYIYKTREGAKNRLLG